ncbi:MAG: hypothetical protein GX808_08705 [Syntrophomonadaceae bacterium]|nr:hypothetical protein [Syntrophomonadaceae bacterium]
MKQLILPVILPVILFLGIKIFVPDMKAAGIFLLLIMAVLAGAVLSPILFKTEDSDEQKN